MASFFIAAFMYSHFISNTTFFYVFTSCKSTHTFAHIFQEVGTWICFCSMHMKLSLFFAVSSVHCLNLKFGELLCDMKIISWTMESIG